MSCRLTKTVGLFIATLALAASMQTAASGAVLDAPAGLSATAGDTQVVLSWSAVSGSPAVSDYLVQYSANGGVTW